MFGTIATGNTIVGPLTAVGNSVVVQLTGTFAGTTVTLQVDIGGSWVAVPGGAWTDAGRFTVDTQAGTRLRLVGATFDVGGTTAVLAELSARA